MANGTTTSDQATYGVSDQGFIAKPFQAILQDAYERARLLFGPDVDLRSSSTVRKLLELKSLEDALLWMKLDDVYNSAFTATASGQALDRLGSDLGLDRSNLQASGLASFKLTSSAKKNCVFTLPPGTLVETAPPGPGLDPVRFRLANKVSLVLHAPPDGSEQVVATVTAVSRGISGNIAAKLLTQLNPTFAQRYLSFDPSLVQVSNASAFTGGDQFEDDSTYRRKLFELPRSLWTVDAVRQTVLELDGVRDALVYDPYGGLDKATSPFGKFCFNDQEFQAPRDITNPYFFTIRIAPNPGVLWESSGEVVGLRDQVLTAIQPIRPVSIFPTLALADIVQVALRAQLTLAPGADSGAITSEVRTNVSAYISTLRLGDDVLYAQVLRILAEVPGVLNVQNLRLRRCPPRFGEIVCGAPAKFGDDTNISQIEMPCGGDLVLAPTEVATFADSSLNSLVEITFA